jgi:hypothetical protein
LSAVALPSNIIPWEIAHENNFPESFKDVNPQATMPPYPYLLFFFPSLTLLLLTVEKIPVARGVPDASV